MGSRSFAFAAFAIKIHYKRHRLSWVSAFCIESEMICARYEDEGQRCVCVCGMRVRVRAVCWVFCLFCENIIFIKTINMKCNFPFNVIAAWLPAWRCWLQLSVQFRLGWLGGFLHGKDPHRGKGVTLKERKAWLAFSVCVL